MIKKRKTIDPPPNSPGVKARELNDIARHLQADINHLPENEREYIIGIRWTLTRYWRRDITSDQANAEQRLWQIRWLQNFDL